VRELTPAPDELLEVRSLFFGEGGGEGGCLRYSAHFAIGKAGDNGTYYHLHTDACLRC